jgi:uncharacterized protein YoxC
MAFIIVHVYMTTTGHSVTSNIKAMISGWELLEEEDDSKPVQGETNEVEEAKNEAS